jgi:hypothetical protein
MDKYAWTLIRPMAVETSDFANSLLESLAKEISRLVPATTQAHLTLREPDEYCGALYEQAAQPRPFDALVELETAVDCPPLDGFLDHLHETTDFMQGWRVKPTLIFDSTGPRPIGEPSDANIVVFVQRQDGTTPEHFDRNWYIHAGHPDGGEAETEASRAERLREEAEPDRLYRQNRILEALTPTAWVVHGYTQLQLGGFIPSVGDEPYPRVRGEAPFDRWPPRILQGRSCQII